MRFHHWLIFIIAFSIAAVALATTTSATDLPGLDVGDHTTYSSDTLVVSGDILVRSGGWLELDNVDIVMGCTSDGEYSILVEDGGRLTMSGGSISAAVPTLSYKVMLSGTATLEGVTVTDTWGEGQSFDASSGQVPSLAGQKGGVQIYSDDVYIGNCTFSGGKVCAIYVSSARPDLYGNTIADVIYDVQPYSQVTTDPSTTRWSAIAVGILLDDSPAQMESNTFAGIGVFSSVASVHYDLASVNNNYYQVIAYAVATRYTKLFMESCTVTTTGVLDRAVDILNVSGRTVNQWFYQYHVAGALAYQATGADMKFNDIQSSDHGLYVVVSSSTTGGLMTFDIIIDNLFKDNARGGAMFVASTLSRNCLINVSQNDFEDNGGGTTAGIEDSGLGIAVGTGSGDLTVLLEQNSFRRNHARGVHVMVNGLGGDVTVMAIGSNIFADNRGAAMLVYVDGVNGDVDVRYENTTATGNDPDATTDPGALAVAGGSLLGALDVKVAYCTVSSNAGSGLGIDMGGALAVNTATRTKYTILNSQFNLNDQYGIYLFDSYGANAQWSTFDLRQVTTSNNRQGVYIHSNSQLGNINFKLSGLTAQDNNAGTVAVTINLAAATYNPIATLSDVRITYAGGSAPGATGLSLQGVDENHRWELVLLRAYIVQPGTALNVLFCDVTARHCNLTGVGLTSVVARDSRVDLYYCSVPDLSAQTMGSSVQNHVRFYKWLNISLVAWQNLEPIRNQTIVIKRYRTPQDEIYMAQTDANGLLTHAMVCFWERDNNNDPLRNDELQAFATIRSNTLKSLWFDFNDTAISLEDPDVPELIINSPFEKTVQKSGTLMVQGEIRDAASGVRAVEVTLDNIVWYQATEVPPKAGSSRATFSVPIEDLTDGTYDIYVRGWDVARYHIENLSYKLVIIKGVKIDTQPPFLQMVQPDKAFTVTNKGTYELIGVTEKSVNIKKLTINDAIRPVFGSNFNLTVKLEEGTNTFIIIAEDTAGNIAVVTRQIVLDTINPTLIISTPVSGFSSKERDFEVSGDAEQGATIRVRLDEGAAKLATHTGTWFYYVQPITVEGIHTITIIAVDEAGNENLEVRHVKYDITPPELLDIVPSYDPKPTNDQLVYVAGRTDQDVDRVRVNGFIFDVVEGTFALEIRMLEGAGVLLIEVEDQAGNYNSTTRDIFVDVTPPLIKDLTVSKVGGTVWTMADDLVINERSVRFRGHLWEGDVREMWVQVGTDNRSAIMDDVETYSFYRDFNLDEGENIISFFAVDIAGNRMHLVYTLDVDPRAPEISYYNPRMSKAMEATVREDTVLVSGKVTDAGAVTMMINNRQVLVRPDTGAFQATVYLLDGVNNIEVVCTDRAGNAATDVLHITYESKAADTTSIGEYLASLWWLFAVVIGLLILIPFTVQYKRSKWMTEHPELENYDRRRDKEGLYDYDTVQYVEEEYEGGGQR